MESIWQRVSDRFCVSSIVLLHNRRSDSGFEVSDSIGFIGSKTGKYSLPKKLSDVLVSLSGISLFIPLGLETFIPRPLYFGVESNRGDWMLMRKVQLDLAIRRELRRGKESSVQTDNSTGLNPLEPIDGYWPPHRTSASPVLAKRFYYRYRAKKFAEQVEAQVGAPRERGSTTTPILFSRTREDGPVAICCSSLMAGGAEKQAALTAIGIKRFGLPVRFIGHSSDDLTTHHYAEILADDGVQIMNAFSYPNRTLENPNHSLDPVEVEISNELEERCRALKLGLGDIVEQYYRLFRHIQPRVVHAWLDYTNAVAGLAAAWAGVPKIILGCRNGIPYRLPSYHVFFRPFYNLLLSDPRVELVTNSKFGADDYQRWLALSSKQIRVIYNGFGPTRENKDTQEQGVNNRLNEVFGEGMTSQVVLGVFRLYFEKDPLLFIQIASEVIKASPDTRFCLLGSGDLEPEIKRVAHELNIDDRVYFIPTQRDVFKWMDKATLLLHTARVEGLPNVLIEAQSRGLPVVTTDAGGAKETIVEGVSGKCAKSRSAKSIARIVLQCLQDAEWLNNAGETGKKNVAERFGFERMVTETINAYSLQKDN